MRSEIDKDNFWQMGDTGPCGPCSEIYVDLGGKTERRYDGTKSDPNESLPPYRPTAVPTLPQFVERAESGQLLEIWNLVFMQYDQAANGTRSNLPAPSVDTGAGLERIAAVLQGVDSNFHTDLFMPIIRRAEEVVGQPYDRGPAGAGYRVLADHARAVAFLLADGVYPSNDGRGYVRWILPLVPVVAWVATACGSTSDQGLPQIPLAPATTAPGPTPTTKAPAGGLCADPTFDATASFAPEGPLPAPGQMPAGTHMRTIQDRGRLIVGVDENTKYFSYRDPLSGEIVGFEPDLARELARAIFGDPNRIEFTSVVTDQKVPVVEAGLPDDTISVVSASFDRWEQAAFITTYYVTTQRILVPADSPIDGLADLANQRVCATRGSSSEKFPR